MPEKLAISTLLSKFFFCDEIYIIIYKNIPISQFSCLSSQQMKKAKRGPRPNEDPVLLYHFNTKALPIVFCNDKEGLGPRLLSS